MQHTATRTLAALSLGVLALTGLVGCGSNDSPAATTSPTASPSADPTDGSLFHPVPIPDPGPAESYATCAEATTAYGVRRDKGIQDAIAGQVPAAGGEAVGAERIVAANPTCFNPLQVQSANSLDITTMNNPPEAIVDVAPACRQTYLDGVHLLSFAAGLAATGPEKFDLSPGVSALRAANPTCMTAKDEATLRRLLVKGVAKARKAMGTE